MKGKTRAGKTTGDLLLVRTFATRDEVGDHTEEFAQHTIAAGIAEYQKLGLNNKEAERLFFIRKSRTFTEKNLLSQQHAVFRSILPEVWDELDRTKDDAHRVQICARNNLIQVFSGMSVPEIVMFVKVAAWAFCGLRLPGYRKHPKWKRSKGRRQGSNIPPLLRPKIPFARTLPHGIAA